MLTAKFEAPVSDWVKDSIEYAVSAANALELDADACLDQLASGFRQSFLPMWVYRGGHHIALHHLDGNSPYTERAVIIS